MQKRVLIEIVYTNPKYMVEESVSLFTDMAYFKKVKPDRNRLLFAST